MTKIWKSLESLYFASKEPYFNFGWVTKQCSALFLSTLLAACCKHFSPSICLVVSMENAKNNNLTDKIVFFQHHYDSQRPWMKCSVPLKESGNLDKWRIKEMACLTHEQYPVPIQDQRYASGPLCHPSTFHWCLIRHGQYGRLTWQAILKHDHYIRRRSGFWFHHKEHIWKHGHNHG